MQRLFDEVCDARSWESEGRLVARSAGQLWDTDSRGGEEFSVADVGAWCDLYLCNA